MTTGGDSDTHSSQGDSGGDNTPAKISSKNGSKDGSLSSKKFDNIKIIQIANIAPQASKEQMQNLFGYMGKIDEIRMYPTIDLGMTATTKICFIKFYETHSVGVAQHLTNTVFIDRALIVIPYADSVEVPDEQKGLELLNSGTLLPGIADPKLPQHVSSQVLLEDGYHQAVSTHDPRLIENDLPPYPNLPTSLDTRKIEEIRRTIIVANVDVEWSAPKVMDYFSQAGEVKYFRFCTRDNDPLRYALIEFTEQPSILEALKLNGTQLGSKIIKVYHATQAIVKPQAKTNEAAQKEIEDAMSRQAETLLSQGIDAAGSHKDKRRSRSRSRKRSRSRGRSRRSRTRSRSRRRSRSKSRRRSSSRRKHRSKRSRSRSRSRRSKSKRRSRSKDRSRRSRSRSRSRRSRSRSRRKEHKSKKSKKDKDRDKDKEKSRDKGKGRDKDKEKKDKEKSKHKEREPSYDNNEGTEDPDEDMDLEDD